MKNLHRLIVLTIILAIALPFSAFAQSPAVASPSDVVTFTVLHTNDFHGNLEPSGSNPGMARTADVIKDVRTAVGADKTMLLDAGDIMQGSLLSNLQKGEPTIAVYNSLGYMAATFGNHEFDWGQTVLKDRVTQATFPFVAANLVTKTGADCSTAGWDAPDFAQPYIVKTVGTAPNDVQVGIIGVTSIETPFITIAAATEGLCFKDPQASILHYYDEVDAASDVIIVLSHLGNTDGGYGYGFPVTGDQTLAKNLIAAGKPVSLIIGGHSHTDLAAAQEFTGTVNGKAVKTLVAQAHYAGRKVGRADFSYDTTTGEATVTWSRLTVSTSGDKDPETDALIATYTSDPAYQAKIKEVFGYTNVPLVRDYNGDNLMGAFIQDAILHDLNTDATTANDADMVFNNPGGIRADITSPTATYPYTLTYGLLFGVLPFGNQTVVGDMTGASIVELLNQSASLFKGAIQVSGIKYSFYNYTDASPGPQPWAWGAFDISVKNRTTNEWEPLDLDKTYRVATNEFLAPAGQDGFSAFKYMTNISYWGDMLDGVDRAVADLYPTVDKAYNGPKGDGALDGRITRNGTAAGGDIIPVTVLHHSDSHGNLAKGSYVGYTQLATLIKQERARNPQRTVLLTAGDNVQGDAMMYYFKTAGLGYAADGTQLDPALRINPLIAAFNAMDYDAYTLGNHEFNFGHEVFTSTLKQATFPILQANLSDTGEYGLNEVGVKPSHELTLGDIKVGILGIGNHRVPNYELPSNIPGLTFSNPIVKAQELGPQLKANNDLVIALTHIGFTTNPKSVEVDNNVDTVLAVEAGGIDLVIGGHSHTDPTKKTDSSGNYQYLPAILPGVGNTPVLVHHSYRYNNYLGEIIVGLRPKTGGGYEVVTRSGRNIAVVKDTTLEDLEIKAIVDPYVTLLNAYNNTELGQTTAPIDALKAYTEETNGANMQADAAVAELARNGITVDFHLSGAMSNRKVADAATPDAPVTLKVSDMFSLMPYENSLVVMKMNGPQLKAVLERAYRNYYYYKYVTGYGGYSYYTTCMIDINAGGHIKYRDSYPYLPDGNNVESLTFGTTTVDFTDATKFYEVSTVNYLAAGSCNFNNSGVSLWPLNQISHDTQYYVRDAVINYVKDMKIVSPAIEGRLEFMVPSFFYMPLVSYVKLP